MSDKTWDTTVLVGDVGGTRTRLALYAPEAKAPLARASSRAGSTTGSKPIVQAFLAQNGGAAPSFGGVRGRGPGSRGHGEHHQPAVEAR